ncbi:DUF1800 domain-containing protein [Seohaeicola zhoushanensis]|uniref:DUF1800 domain-containing protein n=1 Tax=Seohaeicola zhoushanensis TaxID=1569283 RepID=A0A8J3M4V8_9RHOB|nr:DUF1800 domain-containing protein [Seohaeicola zhoushanensis]GHF40836.1 hypothetical protein GCM10017056_10550 [Seohaeicola zhoushanensis]
MAGFSPDLAEIRFGCGLSPTIAPPTSTQAMLQGLQGPDEMAQRFAIDSYADYETWLTATRHLRKGEDPQDKRDKMQALEAFKKARRDQALASLGWAMQAQLRWTWTGTGFRERLVSFWADHFTAMGKNVLMRTGVAPYVETSIRPHVAASFPDLVIAAVTSPLMLHYLDQVTSVGPNSRAARRREALGGLNENLAREVMELHTLGVGGPYTQDDVRQLAELFTGLSVNKQSGFAFRPAYAEPGAETILGRRYGGDPARLDSVHAALRDLALHPATAEHISRKLAVHFVSDTPDPDLVSAMTARFLDTGGDLVKVYSVLLGHPAAWAEPLRNVKPPQHFVGSAWRALAVTPERVAAMRPREIRQGFDRPLATMGQPWLTPNGPDGFPEQDEAWVTPQGVAARLLWAVNVPQTLRPQLPDPRAFVDQALGRFATDAVRFAAAAAESQAEAVGLVLASPAFQRR